MDKIKCDRCNKEFIWTLNDIATKKNGTVPMCKECQKDAFSEETAGDKR